MMYVNIVCVYSQIQSSFGEELPSSQVSLQAVLFIDR